jgi:hypothetical protein
MASIRTRTIAGVGFPLSVLATAVLVAATSCVVKNSGSDDDAGEGGGSGEPSSGGTGGSGATAGSGSSGKAGTTSGGAGATMSNGGSGATAGSTAAGGGGSSGSSAAGTSAAVSGGEAGAAPSDNCPGSAEPDQTDTDDDGQGDVCDADDDDDGFNDDDDPEPKNPAVPGDYSTPEKVLANPKIQEALKALHDAGFDLPTHTETTPPDVSGYLRKEDGDGEFVANSGGGGVGQSIVGHEKRVELNDDATLDSYEVSFADDEPTAYGIRRGQLLRGTGNEFTIYSASRTVCTEGGADFATYSLGITSGTLDAATGNWKDVLALHVTVATSGTRTSTCANRFNGETENVDAWTASSIPLVSEVEPATLEYLCVEGDAGYAPTETWTGAAGKACECTAEYAVSCEP